MKSTKGTRDLICELGYLIANTCYNPSSLNGLTLEEGCSFRYPVYYLDKNGEISKCWYKIDDLYKDGLDSMHYKFGANELYIGHALEKVLNRWEEKFGLDFNELTKRKRA